MYHHKFFISEENFGDQGTEEDVHQMVNILIPLGWNVEYGDSIHNVSTDMEQYLFDKAFYTALEAKVWMVLNPSTLGPQALAKSELTQI